MKSHDRSELMKLVGIKSYTNKKYRIVQSRWAPNSNKLKQKQIKPEKIYELSRK